MNNIKERIKELSEIIKRHPCVDDLYIERAKLYEKLKLYKQALDDYKKTFPDYYICKNIVTVCEDNGLIKEAERLYTKAINADINNIEVYIKRICFYMRTGEIEKAITDCKTVLKLFPKDENILTLKKILTKK